MLARATLPAEAYGTLVSPGRPHRVRLGVGAARVALFEPLTLRPLGEIAVGEHPNAMALSRDGGRLFVACANTNAVWAIDLASRQATEQIGVALRPDAPPGQHAQRARPLARRRAPCSSRTPTTTRWRWWTSAAPGESRPSGFIPTGWYPTGVGLRRLRRATSSCSAARASPPRRTRAGRSPVDCPSARGRAVHRRASSSGALSVLPRPDPEALERMTRARLRPERGQRRGRRRGPRCGPRARPSRAAEAPRPSSTSSTSIRENRTYDQVLGDLPRGNGDPNLTLFGEEVTPNAHALARGVRALRQLLRGRRGEPRRPLVLDGRLRDRRQREDLAHELRRAGRPLPGRGRATGCATPTATSRRPPGGYLWDFAARAGVSVRSYGEFAALGRRRAGPVRASVPGLEGKVHPSYAPFDLSIPDGERVDTWLEEFRRFEKDGGLPRLNIFHLGNDHTEGTQAGQAARRARWWPRTTVALGRLVEAISKSRFWPRVGDLRPGGRRAERAGPRGRPPLGPARGQPVGEARRRWTRRSTPPRASCGRSSSILGLPPMSQYDAAATPLFAAFATQARPGGRSRVRPARVTPRREEPRGRPRGAGLAAHEPRRGRTSPPSASSTRSSGSRCAARTP